VVENELVQQKAFAKVGSLGNAGRESEIGGERGGFRDGSSPTHTVLPVLSVNHLKPSRFAFGLSNGSDFGEPSVPASEDSRKVAVSLYKTGEGIAGITVEVEAALEPDVSAREVDDFGVLVVEFGLDAFDEVAAEGIVVIESRGDDEVGVLGEALTDGLRDGVWIVFGDVDRLEIGKVATIGEEAIFELIGGGVVKEDEPSEIGARLGLDGWKAKLFEQYNPVVEPLGTGDESGIVRPFAHIESGQDEMLKLAHRKNPA